jgi:hypothetical protein
MSHGPLLQKDNKAKRMSPSLQEKEQHETKKEERALAMERKNYKRGDMIAAAGAAMAHIVFKSRIYSR